jgi:hypothetical protein
MIVENFYNKNKFTSKLVSVSIRKVSRELERIVKLVKRMIVRVQDLLGSINPLSILNTSTRSRNQVSRDKILKFYYFRDSTLGIHYANPRKYISPILNKNNLLRGGSTYAPLLGFHQTRCLAWKRETTMKH